MRGGFGRISKSFERCTESVTGSSCWRREKASSWLVSWAPRNAARSMAAIRCQASSAPRNLVCSRSFAAAEAIRLDLAPGDYIRVNVMDSGVGMAPEVLRRAFEPFFTTKDVGKGTGLGLAQIYGFVKQSGGTATIESTPGEGTTVSLYLPRAETEIIEEQPSAIAREAARGNGKTILVVEDQPDVLEVIEMFLDGLDYRILTATDGVAARKLLESDEAIDLLLTDVVMPNGVSGLDLAQHARRLRQDLKIIRALHRKRNGQQLLAAREGEQLARQLGSAQRRALHGGNQMPGIVCTTQPGLQQVVCR